MKFPSIRFNQLQTRFKSAFQSTRMDLEMRKTFLVQKGFNSSGISERMEMLGQRSFQFLEDVKSIGFTKTMDEYEKRKLSIFNQLNFFQLITGIIVPLTFIWGNQKFPLSYFLFAILPSCISLLVICLNLSLRHEAGILAYFVLYPLATSMVYLHGMNLGVSLNFILFGILSVFFLQEISQIIFCISLSMVCYFILGVVNKNYSYQLEKTNIFFFYFNQISAIIFIFYGLFLIKKENTVYQLGMLATNKTLLENNEEISKQKEEIEEKAELLKKQTAELTELNAVKNKLFSVIAHDLKSPMYGLRTLFMQIQQYNLPGKEIKNMVPDVLNDLNYTTGLMENLLQWAKCQMQSTQTIRDVIECRTILEDKVKLFRVQAIAKQIDIDYEPGEPLYVWADKDMLQMVLRNLLTNAIKFTASNGRITVGLRQEADKVRISVSDSGVGISTAALEKIFQKNYYSTKGTRSESGTGLGLMLCREFLQQNGSELDIETAEGKGSCFSFLLAKANGPDL